MPSYNDNNIEGSLDEFLSRMLGGQGLGPRSMNISSMLSQDSNNIVRDAARKAAARNHPSVEAIHLLSVLLQEKVVADVITGLGADKDAIEDAVNKRLLSSGSQTGNQVPPLGPSAHSTLFEAAQIAKMLGSSLIEPEHMFYSITAHPETTNGILSRAGINMENVREHTINSFSPTETKHAGQDTPMLDQYSVDLTALAREGKLDPVIGRANEVAQTTEILLRRTKNNPVLIGEPGVGKTAIVEGLAQAIVDNTVPELLQNKRLVSLDLPGMVAGSKFRGEFEERITKVINEVVANRDEIILFLDELHTVIGAGGGGEQGGMDAGNILKPRLARGDLHLIGATTLKEYRRIEKDAAFERRFQPVTVGEPSIEDAILILDGVKKNYETHHNVTYTSDAIISAVDLSARYVSDRFLPDKAIDLIDQAGARKRLNAGPAVDMQALQQRIADLEQEKNAAVAREQYEQANGIKIAIDATKQRIDEALAGKQYQPLEITDTDIAEVIANATGIPVAKLTETDRNRLSRLEDELHEHVIGQNEAVSTVARSVRRNRSGMGDPSKPIGSFLFLGPTGTGKTQLAKTLAKNLFGSENAIIRFDMSEFSEKHTASRLVGAPPGYVGYDEAGQLTEKVRRNPYSVILLDEIEKAHPDLFNILLQVLDDGRLTDGQGRTVDFRNTVVIMTSNLGSEFMASKSGAMGFISGSPEFSDETIRARVFGKLRETMRPEFLNRLDEIVLFKKLELGQVEMIAKIVLLESAARLAAQGITLTHTEEAIQWLARNGYEPEYGARPLRRLIQRRVDDAVADLIINEQVHMGDSIELAVAGDDLTVLPTTVRLEKVFV